MKNPLNIFPQNERVNGKGIWPEIENLARRLRDSRSCEYVCVSVQLHYEGSRNLPGRPTRMTYQVWIGDMEKRSISPENPIF